MDVGVALVTVRLAFREGVPLSAKQVGWLQVAVTVAAVITAVGVPAVTSPCVGAILLTLPTSAGDIAQVTSRVTSEVLPSLSVASARNCCCVRAAMVADTGVTAVSDLTSAAFTETFIVPVTALELALMVTGPWAFPITTPVV